jgi:hypothetical protein
VNPVNTERSPGEMAIENIVSTWPLADRSDVALNNVSYQFGRLVRADLVPYARAVGLLRSHMEARKQDTSFFDLSRDSFQRGAGTPASDAEILDGVAANDNQAHATRERFQVTWFDDIATKQSKEFLIDGAFGTGEFSVVVGKPGSGKSVIVTDAACHVAGGIPWHGRIVKKGLVIYFAAERKVVTERRLAAFRKHHGVKGIPLAVVGGKLDMTGGVIDAKALVATIQRLSAERGLPCVWIIIDTLSRTFGGGDQNSTKDMAKFVLSVDELNRETGAHVTAIHHTPWTEERGKGAIDLDAAVDSSFFVTKGKAGFVLKCDGTNDGEEGEVARFTLLSVELGSDPNGKTTEAPVVVPTDANLAGMYDQARPDDARLTGAQTAALAALEQAIATHGKAFPDDHRHHAGVTAAEVDAWRAAFCGLADDMSDKPESVRRRFNRARKELVEKGEIGEFYRHYWPK